MQSGDDATSLGHGIGLRTTHYPQVADGTLRPDWFEVISRELHGARRAAARGARARARAIAPVVLHGVSLSIGSTDPLNDALPATSCARSPRASSRPGSPTTCAGAALGGHYAHDLLPLPYTEEALRARERARRARAGRARPPHPGRERLELPRRSALDACPSGSSSRAVARARRLRHPARREQRLRQRAQPRLRRASATSSGVPADRVGQIHLAGPHRPRHAPARHARRVRCADEVWGSTRRGARASGASRRWSSGTTTCPRPRWCSPRRSARATIEKEVLRWSAPALRDLQELFWQAIASAPGETCARRRRCSASIAGDEQLAPRERVAIYADMYWSRILDVLREDFACSAGLLGDAAFAELARDYLAARPSRHPRSRTSARRSPTSCRGVADLPPYVCELARLEWAHIAAFAAADAQPLALADLAALPAAAWPDLRLTPVPSCALLELSWPVQYLLERRRATGRAGADHAARLAARAPGVPRHGDATERRRWPAARRHDLRRDLRPLRATRTRRRRCSRAGSRTSCWRAPSEGSREGASCRSGAPRPVGCLGGKDR